MIHGYIWGGPAHGQIHSTRHERDRMICQPETHFEPVLLHRRIEVPVRKKGILRRWGLLRQIERANRSLDRAQFRQLIRVYYDIVYFMLSGRGHSHHRYLRLWVQCNEPRPKVEQPILEAIATAHPECVFEDKPTGDYDQGLKSVYEGIYGKGPA